MTHKPGDLAYAAALDAVRCQEFVAAGLADWLSFTSSVQTAQSWASLDFTPQTAQEWRETFCRPLGATPQDAYEWRAAGHTPAEALRRVSPRPQRTR